MSSNGAALIGDTQIAQSPELELPVPISSISSIHLQIDDNVPLESPFGLVNSILEIYKVNYRAHNSHTGGLNLLQQTVTFSRHQWQHTCQQLISYASALVPFSAPT
ncbi:hypothetical protein FRB94_012496 [Tulasnella sp. JGI-2019a]|nr:hypothetical protein FRB94_012496 [Tulasnella sp. JGI-2019a]